MAHRLNEKDYRDFTETLRSRLHGRLLTDRMSRYLYSTDASSYQIEPLGVVIPQNVEDVVATVRLAGEYGVPIIPRGGGSSLSGQAIGRGIILDFTTHFDRILEIHPQEKWVRVQGGVVLDKLNAALRPHNLMVGPDPSSGKVATMGGMTANNSTGAHSIIYGMMVNHVQEVEVLLSDGSVVTLKPRTREEIAALVQQNSLEGKLYREIPALVEKYRSYIRNNYPRTWRNVAGYNLNRILAQMEAGEPLNLAPLIVNSEGTLAAILSLKMSVVPRPTHTHLVLLHYATLYEALDSVPAILEHHPASVELVDRYFIELTRKNAEYHRKMDFIDGDPAAVLIAEFAGDVPEALQAQADGLVAALRKQGYRGAVVQRSDPVQIARVWDVRKAGLGLLLSKRGDAKPLAFIDDAAVPVENLADYAEQVVKICRDAGTEAAFYAHASAGCLHINPIINLKTREGLEQFRTISQSVIELAIRYGGTSTGEHGEGLARSYYNKKVYGPELYHAFRELKTLFDPHNLFNPGKIVDSTLPWDPKVLRFHPEYQTPYTIRNTVFDFSADGGFEGLVEMCNGQGYCRQLEDGNMCPSFRATREERYVTRGRANALRAMMTGKLGANGLSDPDLYDIMDMCLACKACKVECPSMVDMAKLKYEYLNAYHRQNGTPLSARIFGHISTMNKLGSLFPRLSNAVMGSDLFRELMETFLGVDRRRSLPKFAPRTFQQWFAQHQPNRDAPYGQVIFWDDTFLSHNEPEIGVAAVKVLEAAGFEVLVLKNRKCCGRPMVSKGLLKDARKHAEYNVQLLLPYVREGIPVVGVEPSCVTMFRDEYIDFLHNEDARLVARHTFFMEEFLVKLAEKNSLQLPWPSDVPEQEYRVHVHCYQKAMNMTGYQLRMMELIPNARVQEIEGSGCCGMAGAFGYEKKHFDISIKIGEEKLLPAVREADTKNIRVAAAGTSCRHQILDGTGVKVEHPIVLFAEALFGRKPTLADE